MIEKKHRAINFDLNTKALKEYYPSHNWRKAYKDIDKFLAANGIVHRQWSGYITSEPISNIKLIAILKKKSAEYPWLKHCATHFDVTDVGKHHDMLDTLKNPSIGKLISRSEQDRPRRSIKSRLEDAKVRADAHNAQLRERNPVREPRRYAPER